MKSMTGFGRATASLGSLALEVQISSVNRKSLDLTQKIPDEWQELESEIAERVRRVATRGKVHVAVTVGSPEAGAGATWDDAAVETTLQRLRGLAERHGAPFQVTTDLLWQVVGAQRGGATVPTLDTARSVVLDTVERALAAFVAMRSKEGSALLADFNQRLEALESGVKVIAERAPAVVPSYREGLLRRLREAGLELNVEDERVLREIALFADRCDVTEELTRLGSHLAQLRTLFASAGEMGRKAEFILQEVGREVNTIGSKANDLTLSKQVIELKNELERVREQIANVE